MFGFVLKHCSEYLGKVWLKVFTFFFSYSIKSRPLFDMGSVLTFVISHGTAEQGHFKSCERRGLG